MKVVIIIIVSILSVLDNRSCPLDKKEAFRQLCMDTDIFSAIEHFSVLVNCDSLPNYDNAPVRLHVLVSDGVPSAFCTITATRQHEQYVGAKIIGETECNGYPVIFHLRGNPLPLRIVKAMHLNNTEYREERDYEVDSEIEEHSFAKKFYMVWFKVTCDATLQYNFIMARSPSEMLEWGIDVREQEKKVR